MSVVTIKFAFDISFVKLAGNATENYAMAQEKEKNNMDDAYKIMESAVDKLKNFEQGSDKKDEEPTSIYVRLYDDGCLTFSTTDYIDNTRGTYVDYKDVLETKFSETNLPGWSGKVKSVIIYDEIRPKDTAYWFAGNTDLEALDLTKLNTINTTDMSSMFKNCVKLRDIEFDKFNTSKVVNMTSMFNGCQSLETLNLNSFDTRNVENMQGMFQSCGNNRKYVF